MTHSGAPDATLQQLDAPTALLVRLSATITSGSEGDVRVAIAACLQAGVSARWIEELVLQSYLFAGFPRALNAAREWRRAAGGPASEPAMDAVAEGYADLIEWRTRGELTCKTVYGRNYAKLRTNIRGLHPALDEWMIVEGYGKVLSRAGLDLVRRELCIVAACVAASQARQLHSHLHGALNAGATAGQVDAALAALAGVVGEADLQRAWSLWDRVRTSFQ
jgi:4-carboxymuconolactone decarboxylase